MRKFFRIALRITGALIVFIFLCVVAIPLLFKDEITEMVRRIADRQIEGGLYFEKAKVGLLRTFPNLCLKLISPVLPGGHHPQGDSLFSAQSLDLVLDIRSLLKKGVPLKIVGISTTNARISLYQGKDGITNYDLIAQDTAEVASTDTFAFDIEQYSLSGADVKFIDVENTLLIVGKDLDHKGSLRYRGSEIDLLTKTASGSASLDHDGLNYFRDIHIQGTNDFHIDLDKSLYTFKDNRMSFNALEVSIDGNIAVGESTSQYDLTFQGDRNTFKSFLSLLPNMYTEEFESIDARGNLELSGSLKGTLSDSSVPVYDLTLRIDDGAFRYPGKSLGFERVAVSGSLHNTSQAWAPAEVDLTALRFSLNNQQFDARLKMLNPTGAAFYDGMIKGTIDLNALQNAYPMSGVSALAGLVHADVQFAIDGRRTMADQKVSGTLDIRDLRMESGGEEMAVGKGNVDFTPAAIRINTENASWNRSPLHADLQIRQYIPWLTSDDGQMLVNGSVAIDRFDTNRFISEETNGVDTTFSYDRRFGNVVFDGSLRVGTLIYDDYTIESASSTLKGTLQDLDIVQVGGKVNGTTFTGSGKITDIDNYLIGDAPLTGRLEARLDQVYIDRWIEDDDTAESGDATAFVALPSNLDLEIAFRGDALHYDNMELRNPRGLLRMSGQTLEIHDFKATGMGGEMALSGLYSTEDISKPAFNLKYDLSRLRFAEAFSQIETFQALAPIAQFIQGVFNSTFVMEGRLGQNYMPDFNTLTASGFLETLDGTIRQADFLEKISQFLNLKNPIRWDISGTRNWFEVKDGFLTLQEVSRNFEDIEVALGGKYKIRGESDFLFKFNIPAARVTENPVGALARAGYEQLQTKASAYGVQLKTIERFIVHVAMRGKIDNPQFEIILFNAAGKSLKEVAADEIQAITEQVRDTVTALAEEKLEALKDSLRGKVDEATDSLRNIAEEKIREAAEEALSKTTGKLDSIVRDSLMEKAKDVLGGQGAKEADKIKDALEKWDPFKKKKD